MPADSSFSEDAHNNLHLHQVDKYVLDTFRYKVIVTREKKSKKIHIQSIIFGNNLLVIFR